MIANTFIPKLTIIYQNSILNANITFFLHLCNFIIYFSSLVSGINCQNLNWPYFSGSNLELSICLNNSDRGILSKRTNPTAWEKCKDFVLYDTPFWQWQAANSHTRQSKSVWRPPSVTFRRTTWHGDAAWSIWNLMRSFNFISLCWIRWW